VDTIKVLSEYILSNKVGILYGRIMLIESHERVFIGSVYDILCHVLYIYYIYIYIYIILFFPFPLWFTT
jgi:hypothetical protein